MKKIVVMTLAVAAALVGECKNGPVSFRYASWNIGHYAYGRGKDTKVAESNATVRAWTYNGFLDELNADVLGICEYSENFTSNGAYKASSCVFGRYREQIIGPQESWQWNCQFINRFKVLDRRIKHYPKHHQNTYYVASKVCLGGNVSAWFVQTHLDWGNYLPGHEDDRNDQIRILIEDFRNEPRVVISGDFNTIKWHQTGPEEGSKWWESDNPEEFQTFVKAGYTLAHGAEVLTAPTHKPSSSIDNIIFRGFRMSDFRRYDCKDLSDHMAIGCTLTVK